MNAPVLPDISKRVAQYVALRDLIGEKDDAHKAQMKPYRETLEQLNSVLLQHLKGINAESAATEAGTVYQTAKKSASIADMTAFWEFVKATGDFDLVDKKANVTAVEAYIETNNAPPPGVNFTTRLVVGVRRG